MRLENDTRASAALQVVNLLEPELRAVAIVKKTYELAADGRLTESDEPLSLVPDQLITDFGQFHGELFFRKRGVDLCVLGTVRLDAPVARTQLRLDWPGGGHSLCVTGDRVWTKSRSGDLIPSAAAPFREMPLSYARAYGGTTEVGGEDVAWPDNPVGRGYYETAEQAVGHPLPNVEPADHPGSHDWRTRVPVVGWGPYPMYWGLRATRALKSDPSTGSVLDVSTELFNHAHPDLIVRRLDPGAMLRLTGMRPRPIDVLLPRERPIVRIAVGTSTSEAAGELDGVFIWVDAARVVVTWRARFRYAVRNEELRSARLIFADLGGR
jgi:hypothetical protein